jgi:hypothetical protein
MDGAAAAEATVGLEGVSMRPLDLPRGEYSP